MYVSLSLGRKKERNHFHRPKLYETYGRVKRSSPAESEEEQDAADVVDDAEGDEDDGEGGVGLGRWTRPVQPVIVDHGRVERSLAVADARSVAEHVFQEDDRAFT